MLIYLLKVISWSGCNSTEQQYYSTCIMSEYQVSWGFHQLSHCGSHFPSLDVLRLPGLTVSCAHQVCVFLHALGLGFLEPGYPSHGQIRWKGLVHGVLSLFLIKLSTVSESPSVASGLCKYWDNLGRDSEWSTRIFMGSVLFILPVLVEGEASRHVGTSERSGLSHFQVSISSSPACREQSNSGHLSFWVKFYMIPQFKKNLF